MKTIFFDYDGCLHDSLYIYAPAFRKAQAYLVQSGFAENRIWSDSEIQQWIGLNPREMWQKFRPDLPEHIREKASALLGEHMLTITGTSARLYPGALETLDALRQKGFALVLISNCRAAYLDAHKQAFSLDRYFDQMISSEAWQYASKSYILSRVRGLYPAGHAMVGDREIDMMAGKLNGMIAIGARYGYASSPGELDKADILIDRIEELTQVF